MLHEDVRQARIDHGFTQLKLAKLAGVPRSQLRKFESGGNITIFTLRKILSQLPKLKTVSFESVKLELDQTNVGALRAELTELMASASRVLELLDHVRAKRPDAAEPPAGATRFEGGLQIPVALEERLRTLEEAIERQEEQEHEA
jgi:transcriptional regulator with XRE-family HTH domain